MIELTIEEARRLFTYDAENGVLYHKINKVHARAGSPAGTVTSRGYLVVGFNRKQYKVHRIAWLLHYGSWPIGDIDHINHQPLDNRIDNLRDTGAEGEVSNFWNQPVFSTNTSGITGVCWDKRANKWRAYIMVKGKRLHLGKYSNIDEAIAVRLRAEEEHGFHENHGT